MTEDQDLDYTTQKPVTEYLSKGRKSRKEEAKDLRALAMNLSGATSVKKVSSSEESQETSYRF